jgi:hypothetical protein
LNRNEKLIYKNEQGQQIEFSVWSPFFIEEVEGLNNIKNEVDFTKSVGQDGFTYVDSTYNSRNIILQGVITEYKDINRKRMLNTIKKISTLYYKKNDIKRKIKCVLENIVVNEKNKFQISLICPDPFWQDLKEHETALVTWIPNLEFPAQENKGIEFFHTEQTPNYWLETSEDILFEEIVTEFGRGIGQEWGYRELKQIVEVNNVGDVKCPLRVVFRANGDVEKPYIQNIESYELIRINRTLKSGDVLEITTGYGNKNVFLNGKKAHQYLDFLNSSWLQLKPGGNLIKYGAEKGLENLECTIFYTQLYLGV